MLLLYPLPRVLDDIIAPLPCTGAAFSQVRLQAGDDAGAVAWTEASSTLELYANHAHFVQEVVKLHSAAW